MKHKYEIAIVVTYVGVHEADIRLYKRTIRAKSVDDALEKAKRKYSNRLTKSNAVEIIFSHTSIASYSYIKITLETRHVINEHHTQILKYIHDDCKLTERIFEGIRNEDFE